MDMKKKLKDESGIALITALLFMVLLTVLGTAGIMTSSTDVKISDNFQNYQEAFYSADGAGQLGINWLLTNHDVSYHLTNVDYDLDGGGTSDDPAATDPADATDYGYEDSYLASSDFTYKFQVVSLDPDPSPPTGYTTKQRTQETEGFSSKQTTSYAASTKMWNYYYQIDAIASGPQSAATTLNIITSYRSEN
tara:strand:+ start:3657 stop:4235 length:579 start_codon:yes stop_codon:yes gene_type:complete